jgi:hypothetical protein
MRQSVAGARVCVRLVMCFASGMAHLRAVAMSKLTKPRSTGRYWRVVSWIRADLPDPGISCSTRHNRRAWRAVMSEKCRPFDFQHSRLRKFFQSLSISSDLGTAMSHLLGIPVALGWLAAAKEPTKWRRTSRYWLSNAAFSSAQFSANSWWRVTCRGTISRKKRMSMEPFWTKRSGLRFATSIRNQMAGRVTSRQVSRCWR